MFTTLKQQLNATTNNSNTMATKQQSTEEYFLAQIEEIFKSNNCEADIKKMARKAFHFGGVNPKEVEKSYVPAMQTLSAIFLRLSKQFEPPISGDIADFKRKAKMISEVI